MDSAAKVVALANDIRRLLNHSSTISRYASRSLYSLRSLHWNIRRIANIENPRAKYSYTYVTRLESILVSTQACITRYSRLLRNPERSCKADLAVIPVDIERYQSSESQEETVNSMVQWAWRVGVGDVVRLYVIEPFRLSYHELRETDLHVLGNDIFVERQSP